MSASDASMDAPSANVDAASSVSSYVFVSVTVRSSPGSCVDCWRRLEFTNQRFLILEDAAGLEQFALSDAEYAELAAIANSAGFVQALRDRSCRRISDADMSIAASFENSEELSDPWTTGCAGDPNNLSHPYAKLYWKLVALKKAYLDCPPFDPAITWDTTKPPPMRMLCYACGGNC